MMRQFTGKCVAAVFLIVMGCGVSPAADIVSGEIVEYGYYEKKGEFKRHQNIATTSGYVQEGKEVELVEQTERIPLAKNRLFGFKFRITGFEDKNAVQLKLVVSHPEITRSNGSKSTGYTYPVLLDVKGGVIENRSGYSIDHDYEMVEGEWQFELWYYKQKLVSQTFRTVAADDVKIEPENDSQKAAPSEEPRENQQSISPTQG